jgi:transcription termination factor Rho
MDDWKEFKFTGELSSKYTRNIKNSAVFSARNVSASNTI